MRAAYFAAIELIAIPFPPGTHCVVLYAHYDEIPKNTHLSSTLLARHAVPGTRALMYAFMLMHRDGWYINSAS